MSSYLIQALIIIIIVAFATTIGLILFKKQDKASKYVTLYLLSVLATESISLWSAYQYQQNNPIYNIANIIDFILISLFFNYSISSFKKHNTGIKILLGGTFLAVINLLLLQSIYILNTNFLAFESVAIVGMCLYYFYDFLKSDTYITKLPIHFWISALLLIFWSFTLFHWLVGFYLMYTKSNMAEWPYHIITVVSALTYLSFGILFFNYRKMSQVD